jgi:predicted nucleic acid-binding protein
MKPSDVPAGPILVDTDAFSFVYFRRKLEGPAFEALLLGHDLALSFATVGELRAGAIKAHWGATRRQELEKAMSAYTVLRPVSQVVDLYAELHARLHSQLKGGGVNDMWTAACAVAYQMPIATNNLSDFRTIATVLPVTLIHPDVAAGA